MPVLITPAARQVPYLRARQTDIITEIVSHGDGTVVTAVVTLGDPTATFTPDPLTTTAFGFPVPVTPDPFKPLSQNAIGAILGSVVAFIVIVLAFAYCASQRPANDRQSRGRSRSSRGSSSTSSSSRKKASARKHKHRTKTKVPRKPVLNPMPVFIPPTPLPATYRATWKPQMSGVSRYPSG